MRLIVGMVLFGLVACGAPKGTPAVGTDDARAAVGTDGARASVGTDDSRAAVPVPTPSSEPAAAPAVAESAVRALNQRAANPSLTRAERCAALFEVFDKHITLGMTGAEARAVFNDYARISGRTTPLNGPLGLVGDLGWLLASVDEAVTQLGGWIPVDLNFDDSTFVIRCLATPRADMNNLRWSDWVIYGRLKAKSAATFGLYLSGRHDEVVLIEYALVYPDGRMEINGPNGRKSIAAGE